MYTDEPYRECLLYTHPQPLGDGFFLTLYKNFNITNKIVFLYFHHSFIFISQYESHLFFGAENNLTC